MKNNKLRGNEAKIVPNDSRKDLIMNKMKQLEEENKCLLIEKQELQNELKCVVYGSPVPAFFINKEHKVVYWTKAVEEHSGLKAEELVGTDEHWRAFYGEKRPCMCDLILDKTEEELNKWYAGKYKKSHLVDGGYEATAFFPSMGKNGTWLHFTAVLLKDSIGKIH
jgi:hypothetical protein